LKNGSRSDDDEVTELLDFDETAID